MKCNDIIKCFFFCFEFITPLFGNKVLFYIQTWNLARMFFTVIETISDMEPHWIFPGMLLAAIFYAHTHTCIHCTHKSNKYKFIKNTHRHRLFSQEMWFTDRGMINFKSIPFSLKNKLTCKIAHIQHYNLNINQEK